MSGNRCESDCRSRGREFYPGPVPFFRGDYVIISTESNKTNKTKKEAAQAHLSLHLSICHIVGILMSCHKCVLLAHTSTFFNYIRCFDNGLYVREFLNLLMAVVKALMML